MTYRIEDSEGNLVAADLEANDEGTKMLAIGIGGRVINDATGKTVFDGSKH
ncbi:hypothetical protein [Microbacterium sp. IEGM 1404]|uniref:hypothetical protein n=1 Tax=Microbacterium sp. IEGM 1404 TaxID=3047084 RepID=UPI0024B7A8B3|nr:hypothetical protein [Microbacterium sp. IEGM 1404]MDI9889991.1 hypothetical protein [Microbacterium sp. IEGM 1404]